ncbi:zona pellucida-like domain-containing protein 1 [Neosynchiropus ocellatus]
MPTECLTSPTNRPPENSDISVVCGAQTMQLSIYVCPIYQAQYNETEMVLNNEYNDPSCYGDVDLTADPPVLEFSFPINETSGPFCGNTFQITEEVGSGMFSEFSKIQYATMSGEVVSIDTSPGTITYLPQIIYKFSCKYPMQYLLNNTQLGVSGVNLVVNDNNGSFISTLSMVLYSDEQYTQILSIPATGIRLKTKIYVAVIATNLTVGFNVLLDRCYATTSPYPSYTTFYDLFVGCTLDKQTTIKLNGQAQVAYFSFEAFRFLDHKNLTVSVFYLHCITRLCKVSECSDLMPNCGTTIPARRKRAAPDAAANTTVTSRAIIVGKQTVDSQARNQYSSPVVAVIVCIVVLTILFIGMSVYLGCYVRQGKLIIH